MQGRRDTDSCASVLFVVDHLTSRPTPYVRPRPVSNLYKERLIQLCKNSAAIPPCPLRSRPGIPASDQFLQVRPQLSKNEYEATLLDLPRPGMYESAARANQHWNSTVDVDFPADLERSFHAGALSCLTAPSTPYCSDHNTSNISFMTHPPMNEHRSIPYNDVHCESPHVPDSVVHEAPGHSAQQNFYSSRARGDIDCGWKGSIDEFEPCSELPALFYPQKRH